MSKTDEIQIKFHSTQKQNDIKSAKINKRIGVLSTCIGTASIIAACTSMLNEQSHWSNDVLFSTLGAYGILAGIMCLRISTAELKSAQWHQKQIRRIQKQK